MGNRSGAGSQVRETVGSYRILSQLGRGGMGEVFLAWDERLQRHVAVKRIRHDRDDEKGRRRFLREARAVARLNHPAIVQIYELLDDDGDDCIVMEHVEGRSLDEILGGGPLPVAEALRLAHGIAEGLAEAHQKGLVHRDLKAANVVVTESGQPKILDFGLAYEPSAGDTDQGAVIGTPHAMSPEQATGKSVDHRSDLFALGSLIYEMLTGRSPFKDKGVVNTLIRVYSREAEPLRALRPEVPVAVDALVGRLLAKDPNRRPSDTTRLVRELEELAQGEAGHDAAREDLDDQPTLLGAGLFSGSGTFLRVLVLTELVDATELTESLGDVRVASLKTLHDRRARDLLSAFNGFEAEKADGSLLLFERPADAVGFALAYHRALAELSAAEGVDLRARVGIHLGDVLLRANAKSDVLLGARAMEVEGLARSVAARLAALADGRQTLLSQAVFDLARRAAVAGPLADPCLGWLAHGTYVLQGLEEPLEVCEVGAQGLAPLREPTSTEKASKVTAIGEEQALGWRPAAGQTVPRRDHWELVERLGEGGFGEVWLAVHKSGEERVFKFCFDAKRVRSLKREVTLLRLLKDALGYRRDIARLIDWSFDEAPYFLEVEYTDGGSLKQWAATQGGLGNVPLDARLNLVAEVAEALAAAHSAGILHQDVKPDNVLVTEDRDRVPHAVLTDFGVGQLTRRERLEEAGFTVTGFTETGTSSGYTSGGTAGFLAPERLRGEAATVQSDVYALGVLLYQLATGDLSKPLAQGWQRDVNDEILAEDIASFIDGDPQRRPANALVVAERIRSLDQRRQQRAAHQALARAQKRRRGLLAATAASTVVAALVTLLAVQAFAARRTADRNRQQADRLIHYMLEDLAEKLKKTSQLGALEDVSEKALEYLEAIPKQDVSDADHLRRTAALEIIGDIRFANSRLDAAHEVYVEALQALDRIAEPDREARLLLARLQYKVGKFHYTRGELAQARQRFQFQLETYKALSLESPRDKEVTALLIGAQSNLAFVQKREGALDAALETFRSALNTSRMAAEDDPQNTDLQRKLAKRYNDVGDVLVSLGEPAEARKHFAEELRIRRALTAEDPENTDDRKTLGICLSYLGKLARFVGNDTESLEYYLESTDVFEALIRIDSTQVVWQNNLATARRQVAELQLDLADSQNARREALASLAIMERLVDQDNSRADFRFGLASTQLVLGRFALAHRDLREADIRGHAALGLAEGLLRDDPTPDHLALYGQAKLLLGETTEDQPSAEASWQEAVEVLTDHVKDCRHFHLMDVWAKLLINLQRKDEAAAAVEAMRARGYYFREPS